MDIVICGAGQVGGYAAETLSAAGHNVTVIDTNATRLRRIEDTLDVRTLCGSGSNAEILTEVGIDDADVMLSATSSDEVNLLTGSIAKGLGARRCIARVHHRAYLSTDGLDYEAHFGIDRLICPELATSRAIARTLRNPGALAIEDFARGKIEMQEFPVGDKAPAAGRTLADLQMPRGTRLAAIRRAAGDRKVILPTAQSVIERGDVVVLVCNADVFDKARKLFAAKTERRSVVIMGGPPLGVWLCRSLRDRHFSIRLFETNLARAEELAEKLAWVTVIQADPTTRSVFDEEHLADADTFVALVDDDEYNILGSAWAKSMGVAQAIAVVQRPKYMHLLRHIGINQAFSPRVVAVKEVESFIDESPLRRLSTVAEGVLDVYRIRVGPKSAVAGQTLMEARLPPNTVVAAIQHNDDVFVPGAQDRIPPGSTVLVIGAGGIEKELKKTFQ